MLSWKYSETISTEASARQIWRLWSDPANWPAWDAGLERVELHGAFAKGARGVLKPKSGPPIRFEITQVVHEALFVDRARLPLTTLDFRHSYVTKANGWNCITHEVVMTGLLAPLFGRLIGRGLKRHLRRAMSKLSEMALSLPAEGL